MALAQPAGVLPVVALLLAARAKAPICHVAPFQYLESADRWIVNVVLFRLRPAPFRLSATLPLDVAGTVPPRKIALFAGVVTEAVIGAMVSFVTVVVIEPVFAAASTTQTRIVLAPSARLAAKTLVATVAGWVL